MSSWFQLGSWGPVRDSESERTGGAVVAATERTPRRRTALMEAHATITSLDFITSFGHIWCMAVDRTGTRFICTRAAIYAIAPADGAMPELIAGQPNTARMGLRDGKGLDARFQYPRGIALDAQGNIFLADSANNAIRKITASGVVSTLAGSGIAGFADGPGSAALFNNPHGIAVGPDGSIWVADSDNHRIRKVSPSDGFTETVAGRFVGHEDAVGARARFCYPGACAMDSCGNLIVAEFGNDCIRLVSASGCVTTVAGSAGSRGFADGAHTDARFNYPAGVAVDRHGTILIADRKNHRIRKVGEDGRVTTLCGGMESGRRDGAGDEAHLNQPCSLALDECGRLLVAEFKCFGYLRVVHTHLPWSVLRVLFIGVLKTDSPARKTAHPPSPGRMHAQSEGELVRVGPGGAGGGWEMDERRGCWLALLPVDGERAVTSPILTHIILLLRVLCGVTGPLPP